MYVLYTRTEVGSRIAGRYTSNASYDGTERVAAPLRISTRR